MDYYVEIETFDGNIIKLRTDNFPAKITVKEIPTGNEIKRRNFDVRESEKRKDIIIYVN